jgi:hypothetical protein
VGIDSRPEGPLASHWPATLHNGRDRNLTVRGLEAGRRTLVIGEDQRRWQIVFHAADGVATQPVIERIVVT